MTFRRIFGVLEALVGALMLAAPRLFAATAAGPGRPPPSWMVRLLGSRLVGQGCLLVQRPTDTVTSIGTGIEALHGATMLCVAGLDRRDRSTALNAAGLAFGLVLISLGARRW
jgi:hypothetical protein